MIRNFYDRENKEQHPKKEISKIMKTGQVLIENIYNST